MPEDRPAQWTLRWKAARDPLTWTLGASLAVYEVVLRHGNDPSVLVLVAGMLGLPFVVNFEQRRESGGSGNSSGEGARK